jgi:hypothetical protein
MATNYQFQFGSFAFGAGTQHQIIDLDGLEGLPELRIQDDNRGYNDGAFSGRDFYNGRNLTFTINTFAGGGRTAHQNFDLLQAALQPQQTGTQTLSFLLSATDTAKTISARVRSRKTRIDPEYTFGFIRSQVTMFCPDPRYYDAPSPSVKLYSPVLSGRTYNKVFNRTYGFSLTPTVTGTLTNNGWVYTSPVVTVRGPATLPVVGNLNSGQALTFNGTLGTTDVLVYDLGNRTVQLNGSNARNLLLAGSQFWTAAPGATTVYFSCTNSDPVNTYAQFDYSSAYI